MIAKLSQTFFGQALLTFLASTLPVIELRGGLPFGVALGLDLPIALVVSIAGNMLPVPFIIIFIRKFFTWVRKNIPWCEKLISALEKRAHLKGRTVTKYRTLGLCILVAIPLPGTGAWTGSIVAAFLDMRLKEALPSIFFGVCLAGIIVSVITYGVAALI